MSPVEEVSPAEDFEQEQKVITLPRLSVSGRQLRIRIRAVPLPDLIAAMDGIPGADVSPSAAGEQPSWAEVRRRLLEQQEPLRRVAELGIVEPSFTFTERESGKPHWGDLHFENQSDVMNQVMAISGMSGSAEGAKKEAADADGAAFPEVAGQ